MTESELLNLLRSGKDEWNAWKDVKSRLRLDFSDLTLDGMDLEGYHLDNSYFTNASLKGCNFFNCDLSDSTIAIAYKRKYRGWKSL